MVEKDKQGKVEIKIGGMTFAAEGEQGWLGEQLAKVIEAAATAPAPLEPPPGVASRGAAAGQNSSTPFNSSLSAYLKSKGGETKQVQRFLATAAWLHKRGVNDLDTAAVSKALTDNHQKRLGNPADNLNQNVTKGYCEKKRDGGFFITPEGWTHLGDEA